jgi:protein-tyrosine phosphatase
MATAGWRAARAAGLSCVVDLRNEVERGRRPEHPAVGDQVLGGISVVSAPTEDPDDPGFLEECGPWLDHPRSWTPNLRRYPEKFASVFSAIAEAEGPILVHCAGGRDRTGLVCSMLLSLAGVEPGAIAASYAHGFRGAGAYPGHGLSYDPVTAAWIESVGPRPSAVELDEAIAARLPELMAWLVETDLTAYLREAGLDRASVSRLGELLTGRPEGGPDRAAG